VAKKYGDYVMVFHSFQEETVEQPKIDGKLTNDVRVDFCWPLTT